MSSGQTKTPGEFEQLVLLSVLRLRDTATSVSIQAEIAKHAGRTVEPGALHTTLKRLQEKGFVASSIGEPTSQRGGRAKRYYKVTAPGLQAVEKAQRAFQSLLHGLEEQVNITRHD